MVINGNKGLITLNGDAEVAGSVGAVSLHLPQGNNIGTDASKNIILNSIAGYNFPSGAITCSSLTATNDITGDSIQAQYALAVAAGASATNNYVSDSVKIFNGVITSQAETTGSLKVGSISAESLDASYAVSVGDTSKGTKLAGIRLYNGTVDANGGVNGAYVF